ncbi:MAG TPA: Maf family protein [Egicoccus sp.]|nr:Maf family protein [Egicoccus sp.]HSK23772.1 Maf family protein [Egicoccus sp.]
MADTAGAPPPPRLVLASGSPRRAELLARLGLTPEIRPSDVDETPRPDEAPDDLVRRLAALKAMAADATDDEVVLAADTEVAVDGEVLGKPADRDHAAAMLRRLSGRSHEVVTGVAARRGPLVHVDAVHTTVVFRDLADAEVAWYLDTGEPFGKAGGYGLQGAGAALVARIDGSDTNVIGLPLAETVALLREVGFDPLTPGR